MTAKRHNQAASKNMAKGALIERNILVNGRKYRVKVYKPDERMHPMVEVNGKEYQVELANKPNHNKQFSIKIGNRSYRVKVEKIYRNAPFPIRINDKSFIVQSQVPNQVISLRRTDQTLPSVMRKSVPKLAEKEGVIVSPMPGTIVSLRVKTGEPVKVGDVVCVLEAMKMENEIATTIAGTIEEIRVKEGDKIDKGKVLVKVRRHVRAHKGNTI